MLNDYSNANKSLLDEVIVCTMKGLLTGTIVIDCEVSVQFLHIIFFIIIIKKSRIITPYCYVLLDWYLLCK